MSAINDCIVLLVAGGGCFTYFGNATPLISSFITIVRNNVIKEGISFYCPQTKHAMEQAGGGVGVYSRMLLGR